ncbi:MAG: hypothetical protein ACI8QT_000132 [Halioglobus sp.]|jgi:hypothetical protein
MKIRARSNRAVIMLFAGCMLAPQALWAQSSMDESPNAAKMAADLVIARPIGLVMTVAGTAAFIVSLPFTLLAGSTGEAAETLMIGPAKTTFSRCLGCKNTGYTNKDIEHNRARKEEKEVAESS